MNVNIHLRRATEADLPTISTLAHDIWRAYYPTIVSVAQVEHMLAMLYTVTALHDQMQLRSHLFYIAELQGQPQGFSAWAPATDGKQTWLHIHKLYTLAQVRGAGLGHALFAQGVAYARACGIPAVRLNVNRHNAKALAFYKRQGMVVHQTLDIPFGPFLLEDYIMQLKTKS